jgi:hypothetical protein
VDPLDGLDDVPWAELTHAHGSAEDVPALLRQLRGDEHERESALEALHGNIWHQGTTYEATAFAVPFLARLAEADGSLAPELLFYLGAIADGHTYRYGKSVHDPRSAEERSREVGWTESAREAVRAELPRLVVSVRARLDRPVIAGFCRLAYAFPEERAILRDPLNEAFEAGDLTPLDQAAVVMALLRGGGDESWGEVVLLSVLSEALKPAD